MKTPYSLRKLPTFFTTAVGIALFLFGSWGNSRSFGAELALQVTPFQVQPTRDQMDKWLNAYWETEDELWEFRDRRDLEAIIQQNDVPAELQRHLLQSETEVSLEEIALFGFKKNARGRIVLRVSRALREKLPQSLIERRFFYHHSDIKSDNLMAIQIKNQGEWEELLTASRSELSPQTETRFRQSLVSRWGAHYVLFTPFTWPVLPRYLRERFLKAKFNESSTRQGLKVILPLTGKESANDIAKALSPSGHYQEAIRNALESHGLNGPVALEPLLPFPVLSNLNQYSNCHGPNCFGAAAAFVREEPLIQNIDNGEELLRLLQTENYTTVPSGKALELGDILVYEDPRGDIQHASIYIANGIVFRKDGWTKTNPAALQYKAADEGVYFPYSTFRSMVFRKLNIADPSTKPTYYFSHPSIDYAVLGISSNSSRGEIQSALKNLNNYELSETTKKTLDPVQRGSSNTRGPFHRKRSLSISQYFEPF